LELETNMPTVRRLPFAALAIFLLASSAASANCQLAIDAQFPVTYTPSHVPIITVKIKGHDIRMMVDSGFTGSILSQGAYDRLNLTGADHDSGWQIEGLGGFSNIEAIVMQDVEFGAVHLHHQLLSIAAREDPDEARGKTPLDGILGYNILQHFDIGLDLPDHKITFYDPQDCSAPQLPWVGDFAAVPFQRPDNGSPVLTASINNQIFKLTIDTGAYATMVLQPSLQRAAIKPEALEKGADLTATGFGNLPFGIHMAEFSNVTIGAEEFSDDWVAMDVTPASDLNADSDGLLGEDYFATHRVFISNATYTAYLGLSTQ